MVTELGTFELRQYYQVPVHSKSIGADVWYLREHVGDRVTGRGNTSNPSKQLALARLQTGHV